MAAPTSTSGERRASDARRALGRRGEELAAEHLCRRGYSIVERNVRSRYGEIDLVVRGRNALVFVEVKTRRIDARARSIRPDQDPLTGLAAPQRSRLRRLASAWLCQSPLRGPVAETIRFDWIGVVIDTRGTLRKLEHLENAW